MPFSYRIGHIRHNFRREFSRRCLKTVRKNFISRRRLFNSHPAKKCAMLKNCTTLIQFPPRQEVCDAYFRRRQFPSGEYMNNMKYFVSEVGRQLKMNKYYRKRQKSRRTFAKICYITWHIANLCLEGSCTGMKNENGTQ